MHAGFDIGKFRELFGAPVFVRRSRNGRLLETSFRGREYWVQTVTDSAGAVQEFAVTSCASDFRPHFPLPGDGRITLQQSSLADIETTNSYAEATEVAITVGASLAGNSLFEILNAGNPGDYKTYVWGTDVTCPPLYPGEIVRSLVRQGKQTYRGPLSRLPVLERMQKRVIVNTYAETAPGVTIHDIAPFAIGVDSILTRTVDVNPG